jgi:hypothetical protein
LPGALRTKHFLAPTVVVGADTVLRLVSLGVPLTKGFLTSEVRSEITSSVSIGSLSISGFAAVCDFHIRRQDSPQVGEILVQQEPP